MRLIQLAPKIDLLEQLRGITDVAELLGREDVKTIIQEANQRYLHWDKLRWFPLPEGVTAEFIWAALKLQRQLHFKRTPLLSIEQKYFSYWLPDSALQTISAIDRWSGEMLISEQPELPSRERYVISSLMEEAIASSQLEGAATTRKVAKSMLLSGRKPLNQHEQMIFNNWKTIQYLRAHKSMRLSPQIICDIHAMITDQTLKDAKDEGRLRSNDDNVVVAYRDEVVHIPPLAEQLPARLEAFCDYANTDDELRWVHPLVKASILHFWLAYDHPFIDGNGRTARAIFYWYLLSRNYWVFEYLSISRYFLEAPAQYAKSYLYTETDDNDLTYFIIHNLRIVQLALRNLHSYLNRKQQELLAAEKLLHKNQELNYRERNVVAHALRHPDAIYDIQSHKNLNNIAYDTARNDLLDLERQGFLTKEHYRNSYRFRPSTKILDYLRKR